MNYCQNRLPDEVNYLNTDFDHYEISFLFLTSLVFEYSVTVPGGGERAKEAPNAAAPPPQKQPPNLIFI